MSPKSNAAAAAIPSSPASSSLENLLDEDLTEGNEESEEGSTPSAPVSVVDDEDNGDELEETGTDSVEIFLVHGKNKAGDPLKDNQQIIAKDEAIPGVYVGSFTSGQYDSRTHKVRVTAGKFADKVIGLPTSGKLDKAFQRAPYGVKTLVTFKGGNKITSPNHKFKGSMSFTYSVKLPTAINEKIKSQQLPANYEIKDTKKA